MKVGVGQTPIFAKISSQKHTDLKRENQKNSKQECLHNAAFIELKKVNQQVAKLQSLGASFAQIQKELGELQGLKEIQNISQKDLSKIRSLQNKLECLLRNNQEHEYFVINAENLDEVDQKLEAIQNKIQKQLKQEEKKIKHFFANVSQYDLDEKMLKDDRLKEAHDVKRLSSSFTHLIA